MREGKSMCIIRNVSERFDRTRGKVNKGGICLAVFQGYLSKQCSEDWHIPVCTGAECEEALKDAIMEPHSVMPSSL